MKVVYESAYTEEELQPGVPLRIVPGSGSLIVTGENRDPKTEIWYNGEIVQEDRDRFNADSETELVVWQGKEKLVYSVIPFVKPLDASFSTAYEQFAYEFINKERDEIDSIIDGSLKLYAVDQSTEVKDWTNIFDKIEEAYSTFKTICERPKSHLRSVNEVRPIETVKRVGYESIPYLAAHSEDWLARTASGLKPARLFSRVEDDDYQIYENRVVITLIDVIIPFLRRIGRDLAEKYAQLDGIMNSGVQTGSFGFDVTFQKAIAELIKTDEKTDKRRSEAMLLAEKLAGRAKSILKRYISLRNSRLYRRIKGTKPVTNPLDQTNILLMDKHYSVVFKLWKELQKELISKKQEEDKKCSCREDFLNYKKFCITLVGYASHVLNFTHDATGNYSRDDDIQISVVEKNDVIEVIIKDIAERNLVVPGGMILPISVGQKHGSFRFDGKKLYWSSNITGDDIEDFAGLLKPKGKPGKANPKEHHRNYTDLKKVIEERNRSYPEIRCRKILLVPFVIDVKKETRNHFKEYVEKKMDILRQKFGADLVVAALPKCQEEEQSIVEYAFGEDENVLILPLSMFDINSFRRIQNVLIRQIIEIEKETCPCCGGALRTEEDQKICDSCRGLLLTTTTCPEEDCRRSYRYLGYRVSEPVIDKMKKVSPANFFQMDSLYQYKNNVRMKIRENKVIAICPHCGR